MDIDTSKRPKITKSGVGLEINEDGAVFTVYAEVYKAAEHELTKPGGCLDQMVECRELGKKYDSADHATNATVNKLCKHALLCGYKYSLALIFGYSNRSAYDISQIVVCSSSPSRSGYC